MTQNVVSKPLSPSIHLVFTCSTQLFTYSESPSFTGSRPMNSSHDVRCIRQRQESVAFGAPTDVTHRHASHTALKTSSIAPRGLLERLPERLLIYLNEGLDRESLNANKADDTHLQYAENVFTERLFPLHDERVFVRRFRNHCRATAVSAQVIAEHARLPPNTTYLCGLLHDLGLASCIRHVSEMLHPVDDENFEGLWPTLFRSATAHTIALASQLRLPSGLRFALRDHACFESTERPSRTSAATVIAEHFANRLGYPFGTLPASPMRLLGLAAERLDLRPRDLNSLIQQAKSQLGGLATEG